MTTHRTVVPIIEAMSRDQAQAHIDRRSRKWIAEFKTLPTAEQLRVIAGLVDAGMETRLILQSLLFVVSDLKKRHGSKVTE